MSSDNRVPSERSGPPHAASDKVAVVVNGNAKQVTREVVAVLDQVVESGDLFMSRSLGEGRDIARRIVELGYPTVLTGGGDGTFTQMVTWIVRECEARGTPPPRFGLLRLGTGNALAWVVGAQSQGKRGVVADLARLRKHGGSRFMRLLEVDDMLAPFAGVGADAVALAHYNETKAALQRLPGLRRLASGGVAYFISIAGRSLPEYLFRPHPHVRLVNQGAPAERLGMDGRPVGSPVPSGGVVYDGPALFVSASTIPYWGFGARIFPYACERDDRFQLRVFDPTPPQIVLNIRKLWQGTYRADNLHDFLVDRIAIHCDRPSPVQVGGDSIGVRSTLHIALSGRPIELVDYYAPPPVA